MSHTDFEAFMKRRTVAAAAYVVGNAEPLDGLVTEAEPASFFGPMGGSTQGAHDVVKRYDSDARSFEAGGESELEILHMEASGDLGYWVGFQKARVRMKGRDEPIPMKLRITELFRREDDHWRLVHRHADMLAEEKKPA